MNAALFDGAGQLRDGMMPGMGAAVEWWWRIAPACDDFIVVPAIRGTGCKTQQDSQYDQSGNFVFHDGMSPKEAILRAANPTGSISFISTFG